MASLEYDVGALAVFDNGELDKKAYGEDKEKYVLEATKAAVQGLMGRLYALPQEDGEDEGVVRLPEIATKLPREKHVPEEQPQTRWEKFAQRKGIVKQRRSRVVWDEVRKDWAPRYGLGRARSREAADREDWVVEVKDGENVAADPFEEKDKKRKAAQDKQVKNQVANMRKRRTAGDHLVGVVDKVSSGRKYAPSEPRRAKLLGSALKVARGSTASLGRFDRELDVTGTTVPNARRKKDVPAETAGSAGAERQRTSRLLDRVVGRSKGGSVDYRKAASDHIRDEQRQKAAQRQGGQPSGKRKKR